MVRHGRRSMSGTEHENVRDDATVKRMRFGLASMARTRRAALASRTHLVYLAIGCWCLLQMQQPHVTLALDASDYAHADNSAADALAVGRSAHEPKFGERLLPLRKKSVTLSMGAAGRAPGERHLNSLLNKSNYVVSQASDNPSNNNHNNAAARATAAAARAAWSMNANAHASSKIPVAHQLAEPQLYTLDDYVELNQAPRLQTAAQNALRQGKQLHRREDTDVLELLESPPDAAGNISKADRLVVMSTEFFVVPSSTPAPLATSTTAAPRIGAKAAVLPDYIQPSSGGGPRSVLILAPKAGNISNATAPSSPSIVATHLPFTGLRKEPWVVPVLVLASLTMLMMGAFEIFVLFKAWRTSPSRRHLFLGQMLLLGLFACAGLGAIITAQPSLLSCGTIRFGVGVAYALVFAALLVKCVFLISLNGGVYLPAPYQGLLLLFAVLIQVAIGAQWLLTQPPEIYTLSVPVIGSGLLASTVASSTHATGVSAAASTFAALFHPHPASTSSDLYTRITAAGTVLIPLCKTQFSDLLFSLIYIVFLIVFVAVLAIKSRGIRDNYREATYIGLAIGGAIPIWLGWMLCGLAVAERHKDACIAFGLVATSATVFLVMFMPKGRQLAAMGKEGLYVEDREEQFSSLSRAGSGYSPSFFHFKPIKYGVMGGGMQNSATNTGNGASMKHCSNGLNGGDRVALVTAAPPSYTRMYHYFPAHLSAHPFCFYPQPPPPPPPPLPPPTLTQLPSPPTLKQLGNSLTSMTQAHIAQTLRYPGLFIRPDETNLYTTLEPTLSSNPNVYFQRGGAVHPGMMY